MTDIAIRAVNSLFALYMLLILLRWLGKWLELDMRSGRLRWIPSLTDPVIDPIRRMLPGTGPLDFGPLVALVAVYLVRIVTISVMVSSIAR